MDTKISSSIWSNVDFDQASPRAKLAALWLILNEHVNTVGYAEFNLRRFIFETQLDEQALAEGEQALGKGLVKVAKGYWLRHYISFQFGRGPALAKNNFSKAICKLMMGGMAEDLGRLILTEYPELLEVTGFVSPWVFGSKGKGLGKGSGASSKPKRGEERRGEEQSSKEALQIYAAYPNKQARKPGLKAIEHALERYAFEPLLAAVESYAAAVSRYTEADRQFIPLPASWFNADRFLDDPAQWQRPGGKNVADGAARTAEPLIALP